MKTAIISLIGDPQENLYQLGIKERDSFKKLESRISHLLSTNILLRQGHDIISRARLLMKKPEESFFDSCIKSYAEGLGVDPAKYRNLIHLFEIAAHYGQVYPELKGLLPGCTSVFAKTSEGITHTRLLDFPLVGIFEATPRLYHWQCEGKPTILSYSCEGLAPLFFQAIHGSGMSFALHHKPGEAYHKVGHSIFQIAFESLFATHQFTDFKKEVKRWATITKWSFLLLDKSGAVQVMDLDGPAMNVNGHHLNESSPLIFTNIPLQNDEAGFDTYLRFTQERQSWLKEKLKKESTKHLLDVMTDVEDQSTRHFQHPGATLSTVGAYQVNLTQGTVDIKEGQGALVASDVIYRFSLDSKNDAKILRKEKALSHFEKSWKRASFAQSAFDQGQYELAYHELQMAHALMPHLVWKEIFSFYLCVWDFKFIANNRELALVYKRLRGIKVPPVLHDQWLLLSMRFEKKLGLLNTTKIEDLSRHLRPLFEQEQKAKGPVFAAWMKLIYPRLEILDVFSPHHK